MVKKVVWTYTSLQDRIAIYQFWVEKNKSYVYSEKLEKLFYESANLLAEFPQLGVRTDFPDIRMKVVGKYKLFYSEQSDSIQIIRVWDSRRDPEKIELSR